MIRIAVVGDIGAGKSHVAKQFGYPVFNADREVKKLYRKSRKCYNKLRKTLPNCIKSFPIKRSEITKAIIKNQINLSEKIDEVLEYNGPILCELIMDRNQPNIPKSAPKKLSDGSVVRTNFEDLFPFLSEEELKSNIFP